MPAQERFSLDRVGSDPVTLDVSVRSAPGSIVGSDTAASATLGFVKLADHSWDDASRVLFVRMGEYGADGQVC